MSKGNSGLQSKFQTKIEYTEAGVIGPAEGFEVLKEVVVRLKSLNAKPGHVVRVCGRMVNDNELTELGVVEGSESKIFHIASWDYIQFDCITYSTSVSSSLISSAYFSDGMFAVDAINDMSSKLSDILFKLTSEVCDIKEEIKVINRQIELITDHEEDEVI